MIKVRADLLHVVTAIANPLRWASRARLFRAFEQHMQNSGVCLTVVECAYGDRPFELAGTEGVQHVGVRAKTMLWTKENLLNLGIARTDGRYIAWVDADIVFRRSDWAAETIQALQLYDVVQPWSDCYDLGPNGEHLQVHRSFCRQYRDNCPLRAGPYTFAHPGYAWAATREALERVGGLIETAPLGAADHHMALALADAGGLGMPGNISAGYRRPVEQWAARARQHIVGNIGVLAGTIEHCWHGAKEKRRYIDRWDILVRHAFDPATDLKRNTFGVLELAGNKPALKRDMDAYFRQRDEDSNCLT